MIEIINYVTANKNKTIGFVDVKLWNKIIIRRIAHVQSGDKRWFTLPTFFNEESQKENKYERYFQFVLEAHNGEFLAKLPELVSKFCLENKIATAPKLEEAMPQFDDSSCPF